MKPDFSAALALCKQRGMYRVNQEVSSAAGGYAVVEGKKCLLLASNDYLGLTQHQTVKAAAARAVLDYGTGSGGARLTTGTHPLYRGLESDLAAWKGAEAALVFGSGYMANLGVISAVAGKDDVIFSDALNHASIIDGCKLSGAGRAIFNHCDMDHLEKLLRDTTVAGKRWIVVDGVFSMDGDIAPLGDLVCLADRYGAALVVDDAHAAGVIGAGKGTAAHCGLEGRVDIQVGTLSKALGAEGGYVVGSGDLIAFLVNHARSYIFSTALAPATIASARAALRVMREQPSLIADLQANASFMREALASFGVKTNDAPTPILPVVVKSAEKAARIARVLRERGLLVSAIRPPAVAAGESRLRVTVSAAHEKEKLRWAAREIARAMDETGILI